MKDRNDNPSQQQIKEKQAKLLQLSINIIVISIVDLCFLCILDILGIFHYKNNQYIIIDIITITIAGIFYLANGLKGERVYKFGLDVFSSFIWIIGLLIRCFCLTQNNNRIFTVIDFLLFAVLGYILFVSIPRVSDLKRKLNFNISIYLIFFII